MQRGQCHVCVARVHFIVLLMLTVILVCLLCIIPVDKPVC